jgi:hypothetical protein
MSENIGYSDDLALSIEIILSQQELKDYVHEICELIVEKKISRRQVELILKENNINKKIAQNEFLDLILHYVRIALRDGVLTNKEKENIHFLKKLLNIEEKSFYKYKKTEIQDVLKSQLQKIYFNDLKIDDSETLYKVDLQELFNLSYDQFLEFVNEEALVALEQGARIEDLDTFIKDYTPSEESNFEIEKIKDKKKYFEDNFEYLNDNEKEIKKSELISDKNSFIETPGYLFWAEILIVSIFIYSKTDIVLLGIGSFILLGFLIKIRVIAFSLAIIMSFFVSKFAFELSGIILGNTFQWIISIALFFILIAKHYSDNEITINKNRSRQIPSSVKKNVWERDGGKCVICGSNEDLEYDHIIPFSKGGSNGTNNIQLLCMKCNRRKASKIE